jgi:peptide/nickel transport system substrate-binding protein
MGNPKQLVAAAVVVALSFAACSGGGDPPRPRATQEGNGFGQAVDPDREGPAAPIDGAVEGGTVTALAASDDGAVAGQFATMDPTEAFWPIPKSILSGLVTRSLTQYVFDPKQGTMVLVPDLATDLGTPNADFTRWSFTIRDGVMFEDGKTVTAEDVAFGIKRSFDRPTFPDGPTYSNDFFLDGSTYKGVYTSGTSYPGVVVDGDTLTLKMARPFPDMPYLAAFPAMGPIPQQHSEPATYKRHPLATGPYKFGSYTPGKSLTLVRNEFWDPDTDPGRHAYPDRYEFRFTEPWHQVDDIILGHSTQGETTLSVSGVLTDDYKRAQSVDRLVQGSGPCTFIWWPDYRKVTDIRIRKAIGYAYPYKDAVLAIGLIPGVTSSPGRSILPPGFPGRQDYNVLETEPGRTDPAKAKSLLREAGYAPGEFELRFAYAADAFVPLKLIVTSLESAGFKATPYVLPSAKVDQMAADADAPINLRFGGWCPDWPSGGQWLPPLYSDVESNWAHFAEPAVDAEIARVSRLPFQEQPAAWGALERSIMTDYYPGIVTFYQALPHIQGSRIGGLHADDIYTAPTWKDLYVMP